ncbi:MAG: VanZ family protein [Melioribacteraceae bacterium]|nr:VanZ family protein [Melioribacteraceae bacterium]MCF8353953.1 VanZ family protein [Melioribacteraceae bacterium]MCF8393681.1 VanZ family protein [Melioribacteraceae bacterium]MCF8419577.1 VanZ family protein [Melioribacteraceae bacterium]
MTRLYNYLLLNKKFVFYTLAVYWLILLALTSFPSHSLPDITTLSDKVKHFIAYMGLGFLLGLALHLQTKYKKLGAGFLLYAVLIASVYGLLDEVHQMFIPYRSAEFLDWLADFGGSILGSFFSYILIRNK